MSSAPLRLRGAPLAGRRVTVLGLGLLGGGVEVVRALCKEGAEVTASDRRDATALAPTLAELEGLPVRYSLGGHAPEDLETDVVVANPAVPPNGSALRTARAAGAQITSETELFLENTRGRVAVLTGTQGKSTTCHLLASLLGASTGIEVHLGGNIGRALIGSLGRIEPEHAVVLEVSSYQLEALPERVEHLTHRVAAGCLTNLLADHLERHGSMEAYGAAKRRLLELVPPTAPLLLPAGDPALAGWELGDRRVLRFGPGAELRVEGERFRFGDEVLGRTADLHLPGRFQRMNALAALGLARQLGAEPAALATALGDCRGLPHRLEDLGLHGGHRVFDNGVSTTPDSTASALAALADEGAPVAWLVGGQAKELPLDGLLEAARGVRLALTFGHSGPQLAAALEAAGVRAIECGALEEAVRRAYAEMAAGDVLLFSPACASFDAFLNFADRAHAFRAALPS